MDILDGLVSWWRWGDCADALFDYGNFAGNVSTPFRDGAADYGIAPHDGGYVGGAIMYSPDDTVVGTAYAADPAPWACDLAGAPGGDSTALGQTVIGGLGAGVIDPQVGRFSNNLGLVPYGGTPWIDPTDGWTWVIFAQLVAGYYILRTGAVKQQQLCGDASLDAGNTRGWSITAHLGTSPLETPIVDGVTTYTEGFNGEIEFFFNMAGPSPATSFSLSLGSSADGDTSLDGYQFFVVTFDGITFKTYNPWRGAAGDPYEPIETIVKPFTQGVQGLSFGARNNTGAGDDGYSFPWYGAWDSTLQWNRALTKEEIVAFQTACDLKLKFKHRFTAANSDSHNRFARARTIRGASGQSIPHTVAGHSVETDEPTGANVPYRGQTAWFKWTAPASGPVTFHTENGSPVDRWSTAPEALAPTP